MDTSVGPRPCKLPPPQPWPATLTLAHRLCPTFHPPLQGYLEDRRPAANVDPYTVVRLLIKNTSECCAVCRRWALLGGGFCLLA